MDINENVNQNLRQFDSIDLSNKYARRLAIQPLYDAMQNVVSYVAINYCFWNKEHFKDRQLKKRWNITRSFLKHIDDNLDRWNKIANQIDEICGNVRHQDDFYPDKHILTNLRTDIDDFIVWIAETGQEYYHKTSSIPLMRKINTELGYAFYYHDYYENVFGEGSYLIQQYPKYPKVTFKELNEFKKEIESEMESISTVNDFSNELVDKVFRYIKIVTGLDYTESSILKQSLCPSCGGTIRQQEWSIGGTEWDPAPSAIRWRIGCEKCDYTLNEDVESL